MACDQERLAEYVAGALTPEALPAVEEHLVRCAACRAEVESLRALRLDLLGADAPLSPAEQARLCAETWGRIRRLSSVSRRVLVRRPARSSAVFRLALAAAAILVVVGGFLVRNRTGPAVGPSVAALEGEVAIDRGGAVFSASAGAALEPGDAVRTGAAARAELALADGTRVEMNERAGLSLNPGSPARGLTLDRGDIYIQAARQPAGRSLVFNPGRYDEATMVGTAFELTRSERQTILRTAEGRVGFGAGQPVGVGALQASRVGPGAAPSAPEAIAPAEIGAWRRAAPAGVIYEDNFPADTPLAPFWASANPGNRVRVGDARLVLRAGAANPQAGGSPVPACVELVSKPVRLGPKPVEFAITRDKDDGPFVFLPLEGHPILSADLVDGDGEPVCRLVWHTLRGSDGIGRGIFEAGLGREPLRNILGMPTISRIQVDAGGRVAVVKGESTLQATGELKRRVGEVSLRLRLTNEGPHDVRVRWTRIVVSRLDRWPEWTAPEEAGEVVKL